MITGDQTRKMPGDDRNGRAVNMSRARIHRTVMATSQGSAGEEEAATLMTDDELQTVVRLLLRLMREDGTPADAFFSPRFKPLRKAIMPFLDNLRGRVFRGQDAEAYRLARAERAERHFRRLSEIARDKQTANKTRLRAERLAKLKALEQESPLPRIPDGPVEEGGVPLLVVGGGALGESPSMCAGAPAVLELVATSRSCYACKRYYAELHHFYDQLCPGCAALNYAKRHATADMSSMVALVTGARVKIGFQVALKLLRAGATVIATSRFPRDAAARFAAQPDSEDWAERVHLYAIDLRDLRAVEGFCDHVAATFQRLDVIVNNACQTIRRPHAYYASIAEAEGSAHVAKGPVEAAILSSLPAHCRIGAHLSCIAHDSAESLEAPPGTEGPEAAEACEGQVVAASSLFPRGSVDAHGQQLDLRQKNSWTMRLHEVSTVEAVEVVAINALAPFVINGRLRPLMEATAGDAAKFIVNVSAMEGKFYRQKTPCHPHTNMAKAALNMLTRTSAGDYARSRIFMTAVDTGWINDENPVHKALAKAVEHDFQTPLDEVDAAARIVDPIFTGVGMGPPDQPVHGVFLKDFAETEW